MNAVSTFFIAVSMSADAFAVSACKGAALRNPRPIEALRTGLVFGAIEALTPLIGYGLGRLASSFVTSVDHWIAFGILCALGLKMLFEKDAGPEKPVKSRHRWRSLAIAAVGSSIDALGVGATLAFLHVNIWVTAAAIGFATFVMASIGMMTGHMLGCRVGGIAEKIAGCVLIVIGTLILLQHTGHIPEVF